jgi:oxygen-independent coproporphyrinogen-3 oxidase
VPEASVGVYVHIPFCERVCPYCDFAVQAVRPLAADVEWRYVDGLLAELEQRRSAFAGRRLASLYFGGGTPSLCRPESIERIVAAVGAAFPLDGTPVGAAFGLDGPVETTLEVNPSSLERARLPGFRAAGVNRVSLGVQSFDDGVLKRLGRAHRADEARRTLCACREAGFEALSLDLIFAAPGQTLAQLERDVAEALEFAPEHLSSYELGVEPGTPFALAAERGQLALPDEATALAMFEATAAALAAAGYERYELANYARPGFAAVHNQRYWRRLPVLGLGAGAFSSDPPDSPGAETPFGRRRANLRSPDAYLARVEAGASPEAGPAELLDAPTARGEAMFLSLRTRRGVDAAAFAGEFGRLPRGFFEAEISGLLRQGLLREDAAGDLRLSARGRLLSDSVFAHFVAAGGAEEAPGN